MTALSKPVNLAIVGCGAVVKVFYVPLLKRLSSVRVVAVSDLNSAAAQSVAAEFGCAALPFDEALRKAAMAIIATPPSSHHALATQALKAGLDVAVEKPFTVSALQARDLVELAEAEGLGVFVAHFRRFYRKVNLARQVVLSGVLGPVNRIEMFEGSRFGWDTASDYVSKDPFGGVLLDTGSHTLDEALYGAGLDGEKLTVAIQKVQRDKQEPAHELSAEGSLTTSRNTISLRILLSRRQMLANTIRIGCEQGAVEYGISAEGAISVTGPSGRFDLHPPGTPDTQVGAFASQYRSILDDPEGSPIRGRLFLNQMSILDAILNHT